MSGFSMDAGGVNAVAGYLQGISDTVKTDAYISSVNTYVHSLMAEQLDTFIDALAMSNPQSLHHVYEWPTSWSTGTGNSSRGGGPDWSQTVGKPEFRLWKHTLKGGGRNKVASFDFLASKRPVPVNPQLAALGVKEGVHIYYWKATTMEAGMDITVTPKISSKLVFINQNGALVFTARPTTHVAGGGATTGSFTRAFVGWWATEGPAYYNVYIKPNLEEGLRTSGQITKYARNSKNKNFSVGVDSTAYSAAVQKMLKNQRNYIAGALSRRALIYGDV